MKDLKRFDFFLPSPCSTDCRRIVSFFKVGPVSAFHGIVLLENQSRYLFRKILVAFHVCCAFRYISCLSGEKFFNILSYHAEVLKAVFVIMETEFLRKQAEVLILIPFSSFYYIR